MSLNLTKLENVRTIHGKTIARCPACAEGEHHSKGEHLVIMPDNRFGCILFPVDAGKGHRRRILELAGDEVSKQRESVRISVRRPLYVTSPRKAGVVVDLDRLGCIGVDPPPSPRSDGGGCEAGSKEKISDSDSCGRDGRVFLTHALRENMNSIDREEGIGNLHTHGTGKNPSVPSADPSDSNSGTNDEVETQKTMPCPPISERDCQFQYPPIPRLAARGH